VKTEEYWFGELKMESSTLVMMGNLGASVKKFENS